MLPQRMDQEGAQQRADAERAEQQAIGHRPAAQPIARDQRQQGQCRRGGDAEHRGTEQDRPDRRGLADIAQAGDQGAAQPLARQLVLGQLAAPEQQHGDQRQGGEAVEQERRLGAVGGDHRTAHRRPEGAGEVEADRVQRHRRRQLAARHDLAHHRLPGRPVERRAGADQEGEQQQARRREQAGGPDRGEAERRRGHPQLRHQQHPAPVPEIGHDAGEQREQEDRRQDRGLDQGHHVRRAGQRGHQPGGTDALHQPADRPHQIGEPDGAEQRQPQRRQDAATAPCPPLAPRRHPRSLAPGRDRATLARPPASPTLTFHRQGE